MYIRTLLAGSHQRKFFNHFLKWYSQTTLICWTLRTKEAIESVHINNGVSVLSGLNLKKLQCKGFLFPTTKQTVHNNEVFIMY